MSNTAVTTFDFNRNAIRVVELDGNPWFVAVDLRDVLGYSTTTDMLRPLKWDERGITPHSVRGVDGKLRKHGTVSESGLYKLVLRSNKPEARQFQDWVTRVVLPTIRKEGAYVAGEENIGKGTEEDDEAIILRAMKIMEAKVERLKAERDQAREANIKLVEEILDVTDAKDALKESVGTYLHTVRDYVKMLDHRINQMQPLP